MGIMATVACDAAPFIQRQQMGLFPGTTNIHQEFVEWQIHFVLDLARVHIRLHLSRGHIRLHLIRGIYADMRALGRVGFIHSMAILTHAEGFVVEFI